MGGFFLSNHFHELEDNSVTEMGFLSKKEHFPLGDFHLILYQKEYVENHKNFLKRKDDFIAGVGTYLYKNKFGYDSLSLIMTDLLAGENPFPRVSGHFCFITYIDQKLELYSDKSGHYHTFIASEGSRVCVSSSFSLLMHTLTVLTPQKQELLEYLNSSATYGEKTVFEEIRHLSPGTRFSFQDGHLYGDRYIDGTIPCGITQKELISGIQGYFSQFSRIDLPTACDVSGGFDTRTVLACLLNASVEVNLVTHNRPSSVSPDREISERISKKIQKEIEIIELESGLDCDDRSLIHITEMSRGLDTAKRMLNEVVNKAGKFDLIFGGWGAELLRNQYGKKHNLDEYVEGYLFNKINFASKKDHREYTDNLKKKFQATIRSLPAFNGSISELLYYFQRSRFWAGNSLSFRNKMAYWLFPFYDWKLANSILRFEGKTKMTQRNIIGSLMPDLAEIPYASSDRMEGFSFRQSIKKLLSLAIPYGIKNRLKKIRKDRMDYAYAGKPHEEGELIMKQLIGLDRMDLLRNGNLRSIAKFDTLCHFIGHTRDRT